MTITLAVLTSCSSQPAARNPTLSPTTNPTVTPSCVAQVFGRMTEAQRVGQLFLLGLTGDQLGAAQAAAIRSEHIGSVWFTQNTTAGVSGVKAVSGEVQAQASDAATAGVKFFVAANQEGGEVQALGGAGFSTIPSALAQGRLAPSSLQSSAATWGGELRSAGVNLDFAPVLDVVPPGGDAQNQPIGALQRGYGHDPATNGGHGAAFLEGLQQAGVAATVKHFPGLGRVAGNTDFTADVVDRTTTPTDPYLQSFQQGIDAGAPFVMVALATYTQIDPDHLAVFSPAVMQQLLRGRMHFAGVVMSDDLGSAKAVAGIPPGQRAIDFLSAGGDMVVTRTADPTPMTTAVLSRATGDAAFRAAVDAAAQRVLQVKQTYGLLPCGQP